MTPANTRKLIGILTLPAENRQPPFPEQAFYRQLAAAGRQAGCDVIVFFPESVEEKQEQVQGYRYDPVSRGWRLIRCALPRLVYDRCLYTSREERQEADRRLRPLIDRGRLRLLGRGLGSKWHTYRLLADDPEVAPYLPETEPYTGNVRQLLTRLGRGEALFLKPRAASQGRGALSVSPLPDGAALVVGRQPSNRPVRRFFTSGRELSAWLDGFIRGRSYLVQPCLDLRDGQGRPFDLRVLAQKNRRGEWGLTGRAVRLGFPGSATSNLHGGGTAREAEPFLRELFGCAKSEAILHEIADLSLRVPALVESRHGRLAELGLDYGIDRTGRIWLLEINSKPGRSVFALSHQSTARKEAVMNPITYASFLLDRQLGG